MRNDRTILVVEDDRQLRKALVMTLEGQGYKVISAQDGEQGLKLSRSELPSLIILDLLMPKLNGNELLDRLRGAQSTKSIPVIILTNDASPEAMKRALANGAPALFSKSGTSLREIVKAVGYHLNE